MKESTTKELILKSAEELMIEKSYHSVGLKQILDAVNVPKGSFYHYFSSKEQFGAELLRHYLEDTTTRKRAFLLENTEESDALKRLLNYFDLTIEAIEKANGKFPCLALKLASEVTDLSESMREILVQGLSEWALIFKAVLDEAITNGLLNPNFDTTSEANFILDSWSGSFQRSVIFRNTEPIKNAKQIISVRFSANSE